MLLERVRFRLTHCTDFRSQLILFQYRVHHTRQVGDNHVFSLTSLIEEKFPSNNNNSNNGDSKTGLILPLLILATLEDSFWKAGN